MPTCTCLSVYCQRSLLTTVLRLTYIPPVLRNSAAPICRSSLMPSTSKYQHCYPCSPTWRWKSSNRFTESLISQFLMLALHIYILRHLVLINCHNHELSLYFLKLLIHTFITGCALNAICLTNSFLEMTKKGVYLGIKLRAWLVFTIYIPFTRENLMCANVTFTWGNCVRK